jgi:Protein of unknown function (DUF3089)
MRARRILLWAALAVVAFGAATAAPPPGTPDYSKAKHWLSLPAPFLAVDVFYLYPTAWSSTDPNPKVCRIDEPSMLEEAPLAFERQATAFQIVGNVYAPYYRQDNNSAVRRLEVIAGIPTSDAVAAFRYYIKHFNNNRPFILVGHSQGATVLSNLLADYMRHNPDVYSRMIAAYVIGHPITTGYLDANPHLKFADSADDTGVIISYNTEAPEIGGTNPVLYGMVGVAINPLSWTRDETPVSNDNNLGSLLLNSDGSVARDANGNFIKMTPSADAQVDATKGVVICSTVDPNVWSPGPTPYPKGVFHTFDIPFYYYNLQANALNRVQSYLSKHASPK